MARKKTVARASKADKRGTLKRKKRKYTKRSPKWGAAAESVNLRVADRRYDNINPTHYQVDGNLQAVNVVEAFGLDAHIGQAVIYQLRAGKKPANEEAQEYEKAIWWLARKVQLLTGKVPVIEIKAGTKISVS